jgi:hypothetical protein
LYRDLLENRDWVDLSPVAAKLIVNLWMLAATEDCKVGEVRGDVESIAWRLRCSESEVLTGLAELDGVFIVVEGIELGNGKTIESKPEKPKPKPKPKPEAVKMPKPVKQTPAQQLVSWYAEEYERVVKEKPVISWAKDASLMKKLLESQTLDTARWMVTEWLERPPEFFRDKGLTIGQMISAAQQLLARRAKRPGRIENAFSSFNEEAAVAAKARAERQLKGDA